MLRLSLLSIWPLWAACASTELAPVTAGAPSLAIVSWNVNYGGAGDPAAVAFLAEADADIVVLQETTEVWERALRAALGARYPFIRFHHCCGAGGLAVLSRHPITHDEILPAVTWFPAWRGVIDTPVGRVQVLNVHLRPPFDDDRSLVGGLFKTPEVRGREMALFTGVLEDDIPVIVAGDFNEGEGPATAVARGLGLKSALEVAGDGSPTWRWPSLPVRLRLDHLFFDDGALALTGAHVAVRGRSDHLPIVARFERRRR